MKITNKFYNYTNFFLVCLIIILICCSFFTNKDQEYFDFRINSKNSKSSPSVQSQNISKNQINRVNRNVENRNRYVGERNNRRNKRRNKNIVINNKNIIKNSLDYTPPLNNFDNYYTYGTYPYPLTSYFPPSYNYYPQPYFNNSFYNNPFYNNPFYNNPFYNSDYIADYRDYFNTGRRNTVNGNFVDFDNPGYEPIYPDWCWSFIGYRDANLVPMASRMQWYNWAKKYNIDNILIPRDRSDFVLIPSTGGNCYIDKFGDHSMFDNILIN